MKNQLIKNKSSPSLSLLQQTSKKSQKSQKSLLQLAGGIEFGGNAGEAKRLLKEGKRYFLSQMNYQYDLDKAYHYFNEAIVKDSNNAQAYHWRGRCKMQLKDYSNAQFDFSMAIKIDKNNEKKSVLAEHMSNIYQCLTVLDWSGQALLMQGKLDEALQQFDKAIKLDKDSGSHFFYRAQVKQQINKLDEAIQDYEKAIEKGLIDQITLWNAYFSKGCCHHKLGNLEQAIQDLRRAENIQPDKSVGLDNLGMALFDKSCFEEAIMYFSRAIQIDSEPMHYNHRGIAFFKLGKTDEALNDFQMAISKNTEEPMFFYQRGNVYLYLDRLEEALKDYETALSLDKTNPKFWHSKGLVYEGQQKRLPFLSQGAMNLRLLAIEMYQNAMKFANQNFISSEFHLGKMYHLTNQFNLALKCLSSVVSQMPNDNNVYVARGQVYQDMGNHQFALQDFNKALEIQPQDSDAYYYRGFSKMKAKLFYEALEDFRRYVVGINYLLMQIKRTIKEWGRKSLNL